MRGGSHGTYARCSTVWLTVICLAGLGGACQVGVPGPDVEVFPGDTDEAVWGDGDGWDAEAADRMVPPLPACTQLPHWGLYATFRYEEELFEVLMISRTTMEQALTMWRGEQLDMVEPVLRATLICWRRAWNCDWHWHIDPATVRFESAERMETVSVKPAQETCDGRPSELEAACEESSALYCPRVELVALRDCRDGRGCELIPRGRSADLDAAD